MVPGQIITRWIETWVPAKGGYAVSDVDKDILKLCVVERHHASGHMGLGFVKGFGMRKGALASSVAHDAHNVIAAGVDDKDLLMAIHTVVQAGGGMAVVSEGRVLAEMGLEIAGLMSERALGDINQSLKTVQAAADSLGCRCEAPFMALSFLALPVIPALKLTDQGLIDVARFKKIPLFVEDTRHMM
jgi:adenine deaminase